MSAILCFYFVWVWFMGFVGVGRQHGIYLSSPTRDWTSTPALEVWSLNHWTTREVPLSLGFFLTFYFVLGYSQLTKNIVIVSAEQWRDSAIQIHISILPQTPLPSRLPHNIEQSSMCYTVGPCWFSILNTAVCTCPSQSPQVSSPPIRPLGNHKFVLKACESLSIL